MLELRSACGLVAALAVLPAASASAAVIAGYNFGNTAATPTLAATTTSANVVAQDVFVPNTVAALNQTTTGLYTNTAVPFRAVSRNTGGNKPTVATPDQSGFYLQFTVTPAAGYELDLSDFSFDGAQGGGTANTRGYAIYTNVDGTGLTNNGDIASGADLKSGTFSTVRGNPTPTTMMNQLVSLADARFQNLTDPFTVRVYFSSDTVGQNIDVDNFVLNGTVSAVPEPATIAAVAGAALVGLRRRRRC